MKSLLLHLTIVGMAAGATINSHVSTKIPWSPHVAYQPSTVGNFSQEHASLAVNKTPLTARGNSGRGIAWDAHWEGGCKTQDHVRQDFAAMFQNEQFASIRLYGIDCNQVYNAKEAIKSLGRRGDTHLWLGIWDVHNANDEARQLADQMQGEWDLVETVSVGNEGVARSMFGGDYQYSTGDVANAVSSVKSYLQGRGWYGRVTTVDVWWLYKDNHDLCNIGDAVAVNMHAYFDGNVAANEVGAWTRTQYNQVSSWCPGKEVIVTEAGWPSCGQTNGRAAPSDQNQAIAVQQLRDEFHGWLFLFEAYNDIYKNPGDKGVERCFGIL